VYPDDRVLVGVINRQQDIQILFEQHWYRIPYERFPDGIHAEYLAFFLSGYASRKLPYSGIYYFARCRGFELAYRTDLLPSERDHKNADRMYYKVQLAEIQPSPTVIRNTNRQTIVFIHTTWARFSIARAIPELAENFF